MPFSVSKLTAQNCSFHFVRGHTRFHLWWMCCWPFDSGMYIPIPSSLRQASLSLACLWFVTYNNNEKKNKKAHCHLDHTRLVKCSGTNRNLNKGYFSDQSWFMCLEWCISLLIPPCSDLWRSWHRICHMSSARSTLKHWGSIKLKHFGANFS